MGLNWTIALPTYDGQQYLAETLASVLSQTDQNFELIVCDDGSNDDTLKIVAEVCGTRARIIPNASGNPFAPRTAHADFMSELKTELLHRRDVS